MEGITERLSAIDGLYFPGDIRSQNPNPSQRKAALFDLLSRDAPIFLERYGGELTGDELAAFDALRADYEVEWHINRIRRHLAPTEADSRAQSATVRNRRRAYMERPIRAGEYFSEDAMREREPYLHLEYLGRFQDPAGRVLSRPGEKWSETLMRRCDERCLWRRLGTSSLGWELRGGIGLDSMKRRWRKRRKVKSVRYQRPDSGAAAPKRQRRM